MVFSNQEPWDIYAGDGAGSGNTRREAQGARGSVNGAARLQACSIQEPDMADRHSSDSDAPVEWHPTAPDGYSECVSLESGTGEDGAGCAGRSALDVLDSGKMGPMFVASCCKLPGSGSGGPGDVSCPGSLSVCHWVTGSGSRLCGPFMDSWVVAATARLDWNTQTVHLPEVKSEFWKARTPFVQLAAVLAAMAANGSNGLMTPALWPSIGHSPRT